MTKSAVNSYDISLARDLSCRLTETPEGSVQREYLEDRSVYVRFPADGVAPQVSSPPDAVTDAQLQAPTSFVTWGDLLTWCMKMTQAVSAFVLDSDGFVVAHSGVEPVNGFEGMGAELAYAMDHFGRVDEQAGALRSVNLVFQERALFGFRVSITESVQLVLGIVTGRSVPSDLKDRIVNTTILHLSKLM